MSSFSSAALSGLRKSGAAGAFRQKVTDYRDLHTSDVTQLVRILSDLPFHSKLAEEDRAKTFEKLIKRLPYELCSSSLCFALNTIDKETGKVREKCLCKEHKPVNNLLIHSIWDCYKDELDNGIGPFLYPILQSGTLTKPQEWKARQLEPVLEMYWPNFSKEAATPPGFQPVHASKWWYQQNECPASCIVGRYSSRYIGRVNKVRSKRVALLQYWLLLHPHGGERFQEAWDLGKELQQQHKAYKKRFKAHLKNLNAAPSPAGEQADNPFRDQADPEPKAAASPSRGTENPFRDPTYPEIPPTVGESAFATRQLDPIREASPAQTSQTSVVDLSEPFLPPMTPAAAPPTFGDYPTPPPTRPNTSRRVPIVHFEDTRPSIAPSFASNASGISFDRIPSYVSTEAPMSPVDALHPAPLNLHNSPREAAIEAQRKAEMFPQPKRNPMYAGHDLPSTWKVESYDDDCEPPRPARAPFEYDVSPPTTPTTAAHRASRTYNVSPPGSPLPGRRTSNLQRPGTQMTRATAWSNLYD